MIRTHPVAGMYPTSFVGQYISKGLYTSSKLNEKFIKTWYGNIWSFYKEVYKLVNNRDFSKISLDIREILLENSPDDICWKKNIIDRLTVVKNNII